MRTSRVRHWLASHLPLLLLVAAVGLSIAAYFTLPELREDVDLAAALIADADVGRLAEHLRGYGPWAILATTILQIVSSIIPPLPSFVLGMVNAMLFGFVGGFIVTWLTALLAAAVCFWIARLLGRPAVTRLVSHRMMDRTDHFVKRHGIVAVIVGRLVPFINPDILSYAAGLTAMRTAPFLLGIGVGAIPATALYSYLGVRGVTEVGWLAAVVGVFTLLALGGWAWRRGRQRYLRAAEAIDRGELRRRSGDDGA